MDGFCIKTYQKLQSQEIRNHAFRHLAPWFLKAKQIPECQKKKKKPKANFTFTPPSLPPDQIRNLAPQLSQPQIWASGDSIWWRYQQTASYPLRCSPLAHPPRTIPKQRSRSHLLLQTDSHLSRSCSSSSDAPRLWWWIQRSFSLRLIYPASRCWYSLVSRRWHSALSGSQPPRHLHPWSRSFGWSACRSEDSRSDAPRTTRSWKDIRSAVTVARSIGPVPPGKCGTRRWWGPGMRTPPE